MAEYLSPGVYVEEVDSGMKPMEGVSTSTAGFIGMTQRGPLKGTPEFIGSYMEFQRKFGGYLPRAVYGERRYLPLAVEHFFANGGSRCFIVRVLGDDGIAAAATVATITFRALNVGAWGNLVKIFCRQSAMNEKQYDLTVACMESPQGSKAAFEEFYSDASLDPNSESYLVKLLEKSMLVRAEYTPDGDAPKLYEAFVKFGTEPAAEDKAATADAPTEAQPKKKNEWVAIQLTGGQDFAKAAAPKPPTICEKVDAGVLRGKDEGPGKRTGLCAFMDVPEISIIAAPGFTGPAEIQELVTHCELMGNRVCILDMTAGMNSVTDLQSYRKQVDSSFVAMYHPWLQVFDPVEKRSVYIPPSGAMAGIYARVDNTRGVHKAPANEVVRGCTGLETLFGKAEQDMLNPVGVNLIRNLQGQGIRVWGARTCSSDSAWKYINVRRLFIFLEESIRRSTGWAVFEPNDALLWTKVYNSISSFLSTQWRGGALSGASEAEAFFVNVGLGSSMTQDDVLNGRMICQIGVAPSRPAEFVIFRISQIMENNS